MRGGASELLFPDGPQMCLMLEAPAEAECPRLEPMSAERAQPSRGPLGSLRPHPVELTAPRRARLLC